MRARSSLWPISRGGRIFLGVEDDGAVSGIRRPDLQEWVLNVFRDKVHPQILPFYEEIQVDDHRVAVVSLTQGVSKPYVLRHNGREDIYIRLGDCSDLATRDQQSRLFALGGLLHPEAMPVSGTDMDYLDLARLDDYLRHVLRDPEVPESAQAWRVRLLGMGFLTTGSGAPPVCTVAGLLLFGFSPRRVLRQAGLRVFAFFGADKELLAQLDQVLDGPWSAGGRWWAARGYSPMKESWRSSTPASSQSCARRSMNWLDSVARRGGPSPPRRCGKPW